MGVPPVEVHHPSVFSSYRNAGGIVRARTIRPSERGCLLQPFFVLRRVLWHAGDAQVVVVQAEIDQHQVPLLQRQRLQRCGG